MRGGDGLKFPQRCVEWWERKQLPFIELHPFTNLSPPLIRLFYQPVPKYRLIKNPASPGGSRGEVAAAGSIQRTAHFRQFLGGCAARVANLATRWREAPLASPGGKLLSEARLMRGGDRSVYECSWMSGICSGFLHSTGKSKTFKPSPPLISQPCRFRSAVMADSFPPGEAKNSEDFGVHHSTKHSVA